MLYNRKNRSGSKTENVTWRVELAAFDQEGGWLVECAQDRRSCVHLPKGMCD